MTDGPADRPDPDHQTVLEALSAKLGDAPKLSLKDEDSDAGHSPVLKPGSDEVRDALPKGKGNYQLMGEIARGGMGVVIKGHDTDLGRDVALKVLHERLAGDPAIIARFVEEAQIGGQLQHPGIVPVYELGLLADERPFFTMKLVKGRTLSALLKERQDLNEDRRRFLNIFEQVCQTIAYAHSRDVLHRDLKPSNIMVGAFGEVQVVDWGLAKVLRRTGDPDDARGENTHISMVETVRTGATTTASESIAGAIMGTPAYMPPEQARGEIEDLSVAADVFALGGLLCEILTGEAPYTGPKEHVLELARSVIQTDLHERLSQCGADAELVNLARECLAPEASARPRSAKVVAERVESHLASQEERARRAELRAAKTLGLSISVILVLLVAGGAWNWIAGERADRAREEQDRVAEARRESERLVFAALSNAAVARTQGEWAAAAAALDRARGHLDEDSDPELEKRISAEARRRTSAESLAAGKSERTARLTQFIDELERDRGDLWLIFNPSYRIAAYEAGFIEFGIDLTFLSEEEVVGASLESGRAAEIARALDDLSRFHSAVVSGKSPRLLRFAMAMDPDPVRNSVRQAIQRKDYEAILAIAKGQDAGEFPPATALSLVTALSPYSNIELSIQILRETVRRHPDEFALRVVLGEALIDRDPGEALLHLSVAQGLRPGSAFTLQLLGRAFLELGYLEESLRCLRASVAIHPEEPQTHIHLGLALRAAGEEQAARESFQAAERAVPGCLDDYVDTHMASSRELYSVGLFSASADHARRVTELAEDYAPGHFQLGMALMLDGAHLVEALERFERSVEIDPRGTDAWVSLGDSQWRLGRLGDAIVSYQRQLEINPNSSRAYDSLGMSLTAQGRYEEAVETISTHIEMLPRNPLSHINLAVALYHLGSHHDALASHLTSLDLDSKYCRSLSRFAWFLAHVPDSGVHDPEEAVHLAKEGVDLHTVTSNYANIHSLAFHWAILGQAHFRAGQYQECRDALTRAMELSPDAGGGPNEFSLATAHFFLAMAHHGLGETDEARKWYDAGVQWMKDHFMDVTQRADLTRWRDEAGAVLGN